MTILIFCPDPAARESICHHIIDIGNYRVLIAETERLTALLALNNPVDLVLIFDASQTDAMKSFREFLLAKKSSLRVCLLPNQHGGLAPEWRRVLNAALKPRRPRKPRGPRIHPRFRWKPAN